MASAFSHALVALTLGQAVRNRFIQRPVLWLGAACSIVPDLDVLGMYAGIGYGDLWGHRGLTHSLLFALLLSVTVVTVCFRHEPAKTAAVIGLYLFGCTASHGMLDALTDGGLGVAFFAPFDTSRYFFPVRPVAVSPIGIREFFSDQGLRVLISEATWIGLPCLVAWVGMRVGTQRWMARRSLTDSPR
jgi:inner membrane protein